MKKSIITIGPLIAIVNYYPGGSLQPGRSYSSNSYRYGFQGQEKDGEVKGNGNSLDFGARIYDPRLMRFLSLDPLAHDYPYESNYVYAGNSPIYLIDVDGKYKYPSAKKAQQYADAYPTLTKYLSEDVEGDVLRSSLLLAAFSNSSKAHQDPNFPNITRCAAFAMLRSSS